MTCGPWSSLLGSCTILWCTGFASIVELGLSHYSKRQRSNRLPRRRCGWIRLKDRDTHGTHCHVSVDTLSSTASSTCSGPSFQLRSLAWWLSAPIFWRGGRPKKNDRPRTKSPPCLQAGAQIHDQLTSGGPGERLPGSRTQLKPGQTKWK